MEKILFLQIFFAQKTVEDSKKGAFFSYRYPNLSIH